MNASIMTSLKQQTDSFSMTRLILLVIVSLILFGCGGSDSSNSSSKEVTTRVLNDSPVNGVSYTCDGKTNMTTDGGKFMCETSPVSFNIGGLTIGTIDNFNDDNQVFPQDLSNVNRSDFTDSKTIKIARILQSLDADGDISQSIDIPASVADKFPNNSDIDSLTLEKIAEMAGIDLVTKPYAISHLRRTITGVEDRSDYIIRVDISDANSSNVLAADVLLLVKGAEVLNSERLATNKITLDGLRKVTTLYLRNVPEAEQDIKVIIQADGYIDSGASITLSEATKSYNLNLNLVKDTEGIIANGVFASKMVVANKVDSAGMVTEPIILENKEADNKPGVKISIPSGTVLTDKNGTPVIGANLKITSFDPYQSDAIAAYPGGLNVMAEASGFNIGGVPQVGETEINFKSAGFSAISIVDADGNKVKNFSNDIEVAMQFAIGTKDSDGKTVVIGDMVPIWSYDEDTGKWSYEKEGTVQDLDLTDSLYDVVYNLNHLSYWNLDWHFSDKCISTRKFIVKNPAGDSHQVGEFSFHLTMESFPAIDTWSHTLADDQDDFIKLRNIPTNIPGTFEVWTKNKNRELASHSFSNACSGADVELVFDYDETTYEYEAAIATLDRLESVIDKSIGVKSILADIEFVYIVAEKLDAEKDIRGNELFLRINQVLLSYSGAFIESDGYLGITVDIYGCDSNQLSYIEELNINFDYQRLLGGPLEGDQISTILTYAATAANGFIQHNPTQLAYAPYGIRGFIQCGINLSKRLVDFGDESGLSENVFDHFEPVILNNIASMKTDVEVELANNGIISEPSGATFIYIIDQGITIAEELAETTGFSTPGLNTLYATRTYYNELKETGKIDIGICGEACPP